MSKRNITESITSWDILQQLSYKCIYGTYIQQFKKNLKYNKHILKKA